MVYFFHHYELPVIIHQAQLQQLLMRSRQQNAPNGQQGNQGGANAATANANVQGANNAPRAVGVDARRATEGRNRPQNDNNNNNHNFLTNVTYLARRLPVFTEELLPNAGGHDTSSNQPTDLLHCHALQNNLNKHALVIETTGPEGKYTGRPKEFSGYDAILPSRNYLPVASSTPGPMYLPPARPTYTTTTTTPRSISMKPLPNITYIPVPITMRPIPTRSYSFSPRPITTTTQRGYKVLK
uniref:Uncharacterized protein n=1 Tax=Lutzomyia longipalpis TaxID=7200 RepID=A0A1B0CWS1_LUTLO